MCCILLLTVVSRVRLLTWGITNNQSGPCSPVATVVSSPCALPDTCECLYCVDVNDNLSTLVTPPLYGCSFFPPIVVSSLCHCLQPLARLQLPISTFMVCLGFYTCLSLFPGRLLHALLAGLLIKLCLQAICDDCVLVLLTLQCLKSCWELLSEMQAGKILNTVQIGNIQGCNKSSVIPTAFILHGQDYVSTTNVFHT